MVLVSVDYIVLIYKSVFDMQSDDQSWVRPRSRARTHGVDRGLKTLEAMMITPKNKF